MVLQNSCRWTWKEVGATMVVLKFYYPASDLFAVGIARSGFLLTTLTPFGFQSEKEDRSSLIPIIHCSYLHADKMETPLLLIHGEDDTIGNYPMQSERYFNALKGLGATVRLRMSKKVMAIDQKRVFTCLLGNKINGLKVRKSQLIYNFKMDF